MKNSPAAVGILLAIVLIFALLYMTHLYLKSKLVHAMVEIDESENDNAIFEAVEVARRDFS